VELLEGADLADLLSFLGTRTVAEAADVRPATVHHHFHNRDGNPKTNARLATAVVQSVIRAEIGHQTVEQLSSVTADGFHDVDELRRLSALTAENLEALVADRAGVAGTFVVAAAAQNDADARQMLGEHYRALTRDYASVIAALAERFDRRFDEAKGFTPEAVAALAIALGDGLILRRQVVSRDVEPEVFGEMLIRLFEVVTTTSDDATPLAETVTERLLGGTGTLELPAESGLDHGKRARTASAVRGLYDEAGAAAITVTAVARRAGVSRGTVIANFRDRRGLAAAVWARFLPELERRLVADRGRSLPVGHVIERHLHRVIDTAQAHRELTALVVDGLLAYAIRHGTPASADPADPRTLVPLPMLLVPVVTEYEPYLRPGVAGTPTEALDISTTVTLLTLIRGLARPQETTATTVQQVMDLLLYGILDRPGGRAGS
jgi:AcrR family transcriptional regulator